ncbi:MAG: desulfoferrodoxin family protein [Endomicrobiales bacterium]
MKGIVCKVCGLVAIDGTAPEICPVCGAPRSAFEEKEDALKTPQDVAAYGESEKKHIPSIKLVHVCGLIPEGGCTDVNVRVGEILHPMLPEHFITSIDFYIDRKFVSRVHLTPGKLNPAAGLHLKTDKGVLTVIERCNIHGAWMNEVTL